MPGSVVNQIKYANHRSGRAGVVEVTVVTSYESLRSREDGQDAIHGSQPRQSSYVQDTPWSANGVNMADNALLDDGSSLAWYSNKSNRGQPPEGAKFMLPGPLDGSCQLLLEANPRRLHRTMQQSSETRLVKLYQQQERVGEASLFWTDGVQRRVCALSESDSKGRWTSPEEVARHQKTALSEDDDDEVQRTSEVEGYKGEARLKDRARSKRSRGKGKFEG